MRGLKLHHPELSGENRHLHNGEANELSPEEYAHFMGGNYGTEVNNLRYSLVMADRHQHNRPEVNDQIAEYLLNHMKDAKDSPEGVDSHGRSLESLKGPLDRLIGGHPLSSKKLQEFLDNKYNGEVQFSLYGQPNLTADQLEQIYDKHQSRWNINALADHPNLSQKLADKLLHRPDSTQERYRTRSALIDRHGKGDIHLSDDQLKELFENGHNKALNHLSNKSEMIDKALGIEGGERINEPDEGEDPESYRWDNWRKGPHAQDDAEDLIELEDLSPHQIDHIMHHGSTEEKWALLNNPKIPHDVANQMVEKWTNDDGHHGYDIDDLRSHLRDKHEMNYEDYMDDARDQAQENYPFSEFLRDRYDRDDGNLESEDWLGQDKDEWIQNYIDNGGDENNAEEAHSQALSEARGGDTPDHLYEYYDSSNSDDEYRIAERLHDASFDEPFENYLPQHLEGKITSIEDIKHKRREEQAAEAEEEQKRKDARHVDFMNETIPNRPETHEYNDGLHHIQMVKDMADANGGQIDVGTMNKKYPSQVQTWKKIFGNQGKLSSQDLDAKIAAHPKDKYNVSYGKWDANNAQNINSQNQVVVRLDHSPESIAALKQDPEAYRTFRKIQEASQRSGHPTNFNTIGWARVDFSNPKHPMIDEVQSDFSSLTRRYLEDNNGGKEAKHVQKIMDHHKNWRENLMNLVIKIAKANGAEKISTHSPESKAAHTGADKVHSVYKDSYQKYPRAMGFRPSSKNELPLSEAGRSIFSRGTGGIATDALIAMHEDGMKEHAKNYLTHENLSSLEDNQEAKDYHTAAANKAKEMFNAHRERLTNLDPTHSYAKPAAGRIPTFLDAVKENHSLEDIAQVRLDQKNDIPYPVYRSDAALKEAPAAENTGHTLDLTSASMKKFEIYYQDLKKAQNADPELHQLLGPIMQSLNSQEAAQLFQSLEQQKPEVFNALMEVLSVIGEEYGKGEDDIENGNMEPADDAQESVAAPQPHVPVAPGKDEPIHRRREVYAPGAIREYSPQSVREKQQDGSWQAVKDFKEPISGQGEDDGV